jgi:hypothetical protein
MNRTPRTLFLVDRKVQGSLMVRAAFYSFCSHDHADADLLERVRAPRRFVDLF